MLGIVGDHPWEAGQQYLEMRFWTLVDQPKAYRWPSRGYWVTILVLGMVGDHLGEGMVAHHPWQLLPGFQFCDEVCVPNSKSVVHCLLVGASCHLWLVTGETKPTPSLTAGDWTDVWLEVENNVEYVKNVLGILKSHTGLNPSSCRF